MRLSWTGWLTHSAHFTHEVVACQPYSQAKIRKSVPATDRRPNHWATLYIDDAHVYHAGGYFHLKLFFIWDPRSVKSNELPLASWIRNYYVRHWWVYYYTLCGILYIMIGLLHRMDQNVTHFRIIESNEAVLLSSNFGYKKAWESYQLVVALKRI